MKFRRTAVIGLSLALLALLGGRVAAEPGAAVTASFLTPDDARPLAVVFTSAHDAAAADLAGAPTREPALADLLYSRFAPVPFRYVPLVPAALRSQVNTYRPLRTGALRAGTMESARHVLVISVEEFPEVAAAYDVTGLPAFLVIGASGDVVARHEGVLSPTEWLSFLASASSSSPAAEVAPLVTPMTVTAAEIPQVAPQAATPPIPVANLVTIPWTGTAPATPVEPPVVMAAAAPSSEVAPATTVSPSTATATGAPGNEFPRDTDRAVTRGSFRRDRPSQRILERTFPRAGLWTIGLRTTRGEGDLDVEVLGPEDQKIEISEAASGDEKIELAVLPGVVYKVRVFSFREVEQTLSWRLTERIQVLDADRLAPGVDGEVIEEGATRNVVVAPGRPTWLRFLPARQGRYRFSLAGNAAGVEAVAVNSQGQVLGRLDQGGLIVAPVDQKRVHVRLSVASGSSRSVEVGVAQYAAVDPGAVRGEVAPGRNASGTVGGGSGDEMHFRLRVPANGSYDIALRGTGTTSADIDLELLKGTGEMLERSEGPAATETIRHELRAGEDYFVRVYAYRAEAPVSFQVSVATATGPAPGPGPRPDQPGPSAEEIRPPANTPVLPPARRQADSVTAGQSRWFKISPAADGLIAIFLDGGDVDQDIDLAVHKADGERIEVSQTESAREALLIKVRAGEPVFLRVFTYGASSGAGFRIWYQVID